MSKHDRGQYAAKGPQPASSPATPPKNDPATLPDGRWFRFRRGVGEFSPYIGADVLTFEGGKPVVREIVFPTLADIVEGKVVAELFEGAK